MKIFGDDDTVDTGLDPANAAATGGDKPTEPLSNAAMQDVGLDAFTKGVEAANNGAHPESTPSEDVIDDVDEGAGDEPELDAAGKPIPKIDAITVGEDGKPIVAKPKEKPALGADGKPLPAKAEPDVEVEAEIKKLGMKEETASRFRTLTAEVKALSPYKAALAELKITEPAQLQSLAAQAAKAAEWEDTVTGTGASPEQFGAALGYLALINTGDPAKMMTAFEAMQKEQAWLAEKLGLSTPTYDPLDADPDLKAKVKSGEVDRELALETIKLRQAAKLRTEQDAGRTTEQQKQEAINAGIEDVKTLSAELRAPKQGQTPELAEAIYAAKLQIITPSIKLIQRTFPPAQWKAEIKALYLSTPDPVVRQAPKTRVSDMPIRPTGVNPDKVVQKLRDPAEAFMAGVAAANERGGY